MHVSAVYHKIWKVFDRNQLETENVSAAKKQEALKLVVFI